MSLTTIIPLQYRILLLVAFAAALMGFGWVKGAQHVDAKWEAANATRERAEAEALRLRLASNQILKAQQDAINVGITKGKEDEIEALTARLNAAGRLRVGPAICGRPAATTEAPSTASGDSADPPGGLVREDVDRDLKALILAVETDLATGRACQAFNKENRLTP